MKTVVSFLFFVVYGFCCIQAQHLKFLGIPIDDSITKFQSKLAAKGIRINQVKSNDAPLGQRIFNGKFMGYNAEFTVFYNRNTKDVYKVEAVIDSKKEQIIQGILDRSLKTIEQKYIYKSLHDLNDGAQKHYQYFIFPTHESTEYIGIIHVEPSYTLYMPETFYPGQEWKVASYIIKFVYEDTVNSSKLTPSTTEPKTLWGFTCGQPDNFRKFLSWAENYRKHECYGGCINYLTWVLDYYKYGCIPQGMEEYENVLDQTIMSLQSRQIGRIKTAYSDEYANVYVV